jgi:hypothetical protein
MSSSRRGQRGGASRDSVNKEVYLANLDKVFQTSNLANEMRAVYHGLVGE